MPKFGTEDAQAGMDSGDMFTSAGGKAMLATEMTRFEEVAMTTLLGHRFGDGLVYLQSREDRVLLKRAIRLGFVDDEGYLTVSGRRFWQERTYYPQGIGLIKGEQMS